MCCCFLTKKTIIYDDKPVMSILIQRETVLLLQKEGMSVRMKVERHKKKRLKNVTEKMMPKRSSANQGLLLLKEKDKWQNV